MPASLTDGNWLLALAALAVFGLVLVLFWRHRVRAAANRNNKMLKAAKRRKDALEHLDTVQAWPPAPTRVLTTPVLQAHKVLQMAFPEHLVLAQMSLSRFLRVPTRNSYAEWVRRVGGLCVDLLVCDADAKVVAVVEIRQPTACLNEKAIKRQQRMDSVLEAAGVPVHVWLEGELPSPAAARNAILGSSIAFTTRTGATLVDTTAPDSQPEEPMSTQAQEPAVSAWFEPSQLGSGATVVSHPHFRQPKRTARLA